jgi:SAM-dependent methyltransferase
MYEKHMGIFGIKRKWMKCNECGFYRSERNYPLETLQKIYDHDYRDEAFRHETIEHAFERMRFKRNSENKSRFNWFVEHVDDVTSVFDIGSGIGIWPWILKKCFFVECMETNDISIKFINDKLHIPCFRVYPVKQYDCVTIVHVLEHIEEPISFLESVKSLITKGGKLFIEVPDSKEVNILPKDHNELSSDHVYFYSIGSLNNVLNKAGFEITDFTRIHYPSRNLYRMLVLCQIM